jgi:4-alpha-glucanotransferase
MMYSRKKRCCGVLLHPSSLPGPWGIGDLGSGARSFVDFLTEAAVNLWQILPLGPTGYGNSPYAARSAFAGNEMLLSPEILMREGWLREGECSPLRSLPASRVDYGVLEEQKLPLLLLAAERRLGVSGGGEDFRSFCEEEAPWLDDYALFMVIYEQYRDARWFSLWDRDLAERKPAALERVRRDRAEKILQWKMLQFFFKNQWDALRNYANERGIRIIGDIPIFVAPDSVDTWSNIGLFQLDAAGRYRAVSGVPPDYFSATGQLWGNPVYDWEIMKRDGYRWWKTRIRSLLRQTDIFRIDHFRGFDAYWSVPAGNTTAEQGVWEPGPGEDFFKSLRAEFGELPIIAEDLGFLTDSVIRLRESTGFPGMKVCQFGFEDMRDGKLDTHHLFLPHNYEYHCVAYSGTHDNDTVAGWFKALGAADKKTVCAYFNDDGTDIPWAMIRAIAASAAEYAVFPMQDLLGLGSECRMNTPSTCGNQNWSWRLETIPPHSLAEKTASLIFLYSRDGKVPE